MQVHDTDSLTASTTRDQAPPPAPTHTTCAICAGGRSPVVTNNLPRHGPLAHGHDPTKHPSTRDWSSPTDGQVWTIFQSMYTPVADLIGYNVDERLQTASRSATSLRTTRTRRRTSNERPCMIQRVKGKHGYNVFIMGTHGGSAVTAIPGAMRFFVVLVDPQGWSFIPQDPSGAPLRCAHSSPCWPKGPQYLLALDHTVTEPEVGKHRQLNTLESPWTSCGECPGSGKKTQHTNCMTHEFVPEQQEALELLSVELRLRWFTQNPEERDKLTKEFCAVLDVKWAKLPPSSQRGTSCHSAGSYLSESTRPAEVKSLDAATRSRYAGDQPSLSRAPKSAFRESRICYVLPPISEDRNREPSLTRSASVESESPVQTPPSDLAGLPERAVVVPDLTPLDIDAATFARDGHIDSQQGRPTTVKGSMLGRKARKDATAPYSSSGSMRSVKSALSIAAGLLPGRSSKRSEGEKPSVRPTGSYWRELVRKDSTVSKANTAR